MNEYKAMHEGCCIADAARHRHGSGVRKLSLNDQFPACNVSINRKIYDLVEIRRARDVLDIGCGFGRNRSVVEGAGGRWVGVEPFEGGAHTVTASAESLPFAASSFDVVIMDAVLEHLPELEQSFAEVARVLRPNGRLVGYVAFMECFHEISYNHLSFKALEHLSTKNGLLLQAIAGGGRFGIDYHLAVLLYPIPFGWGRVMIANAIRLFVRMKSASGYFAQRLTKQCSHAKAADWACRYYQLECLRQSNGFEFVIRKLDADCEMPVA